LEIIAPLSKELFVQKKLILDLGTGSGILAKGIMGNLATKVVGLDLSLMQLQKAAENNLGPSYLQSNSGELPFKSGVFDGVLASMVLEHVGNLQNTVEEISRVLQPTGLFVAVINHPVFQTPGSGPVSAHNSDSDEIGWKVGNYLIESSEVEEISDGIYIPYEHRTISTYLNTFLENGFQLQRVLEPAIVDENEDAGNNQGGRTIPRLLVAILEKPLFA
ncbi:MAG: class I SAM-dependent methyltransferase, partial [Actinomycetota bacterium]|nr:class I SAM-dependent methyltransferase [Actinomycetota bacterium]